MNQLRLLTSGGQPYSLDAQTSELRVRTLEHFGKLFGITDIPDESCPECSANGIRAAMTPSGPYAFCRCGWMMYLGDETGEEE